MNNLVSVQTRAACERLENHKEETKFVKGEILWTTEEDEALLAVASFPPLLSSVFLELLFDHGGVDCRQRPQSARQEDCG